MRGLSALRWVLFQGERVFPRVRGLSVPVRLRDYFHLVFPRERGLSELGYRIIPPSDVFPPHAGVIGGVLDSHNHRRGIPPACGGYRLMFC